MLQCAMSERIPTLDAHSIATVAVTTPGCGSSPVGELEAPRMLKPPTPRFPLTLSISSSAARISGRTSASG